MPGELDKILHDKQAQLAQIVLEQEAKLGSRPELVTTNRTTYERIRKGKGNPTLRSLVDVARPLGFEIVFKTREPDKVEA